MAGNPNRPLPRRTPSTPAAVPWWAASDSDPRSVIVTFHNVLSVPLNRFDRGAAPRLDLLQVAAVVDWLADRFRVVSLASLVDDVARGRPIHGRAALTFDDGYRGVLENALPLLRERGMVASVMVVSSTLESPNDLLHFEQLECAVRDTKAPAWTAPGAPDLPLRTPDERLACLRWLKRTLKSMPEALRLEAHAHALQALGTGPEALRPSTCEPLFAKLDIPQLRQLLQSGWTVGSHTRTHRTLSALDEAQARDEILGSRDALRAALGLDDMPFAYPYGGPQHVGERIRSWMPRSGYTCGLAVRMDEGPPGTDRFGLERVNAEDLLRWHPEMLQPAREPA